MPTPKLDPKLMQEALNLVEIHGSGHLAVKAGVTNIPQNTINGRAHAARLAGMTPTVRKDEPRIYTRKRLGKMHIVIPDGQQKPGVRNDHMEWIGNYIVEKKPDRLICIGDFWDMPSLSSYDRGKASFEGRRYNNDIDAGKRAMERLLTPIDDYNRTAKPEDKYDPEKDFFEGNHCHRIATMVENNPELIGKLKIEDLGIEDYGWKFHEFLKIAKIDGVEYSHYFTSGVMGRPVSSAAALLRERQCSATMGHVQHTDIAMHKVTQNIAMFCGTCYLHDEDYLGPQGNAQRRQIVVKHEVENGRYDPMFVSLKFLEKRYG